MRSILIDLKTGEVYSEEHGWNSKEASIRPEWSMIIYSKSGRLSTEYDQWKGRDLMCCYLAQEPVILT